MMNKNDDKLKIIPLGGLGEIGLNMMVFEWNDELLIVDAGIMFPEDYMLGVDIVIPDMDYIKQRKDKVIGIILTHAHEDHIGALPYLLKNVNIQVFGTSFTLGVVQNKLREHDLLSSAVLCEVFPGGKITLGCFDIEFIRVNHSTVDGVGLAIKTPVGLIMHTGDFKIDLAAIDGKATDIQSFARYGQMGVLALLSDSTNVEKPGYTGNDGEVIDALEQIIKKSSGRVIVALFASNVARIQQIVNIGIKRDSKIIFNGRSVELTVKIAKELGYITIPDQMEITVAAIKDYHPSKIIMVTTGSQGEPMSSLARIAAGIHKQIKIKNSDTIILSSKFIPGNEKAIVNIINNLFRQGADVYYDKIANVHVSGHAFQEELKLMINLTRPKFFIPIHGEYRHLRSHAKIAHQVGIIKDNILLLENGQVASFTNESGEISDTVSTGRILVDGKGVGDVGQSVLKERRILSEDGLVVITMIIDEETGTVTYGPELISKGFVFSSETGHLVDDAQCIVLEIVEEIEPDTPNRINIIRAKLKKALKQYFYFTIKRRPVILPIIIEL